MEVSPDYGLLLRMRDHEGATVLPDVFIPPAERFGLMVKLGPWIVSTHIQGLYGIEVYMGASTLLQASKSGNNGLWSVFT